MHISFLKENKVYGAVRASNELMATDQKGGKERKSKDVSDLFNLRILGIDLDEILKAWTGTVDLKSILGNPEEVKKLKARLEEQRKELIEAQRKLRERYGDAVRIDYDIRVGGLLGGPEGLRVGGGEFFKRLDELSKERARWAQRGKTAKQKPSVRTITVPSEAEVREPFIEFFDRGDQVEVVADLPGVEEKDIALTIEDGELTLKAGTGDRKYFVKTPLPNVEATPVERSHKNGVLKARFKKTSSSAR